MTQCWNVMTLLSWIEQRGEHEFAVIMTTAELRGGKVGEMFLLTF
jgi:hypothetical protein